jgi:hypothetical protein
MKAMAPEITARYQRASEVLEAVLAARARPAPRATPPLAGTDHGIRRRPAPLENPNGAERVGDIHARLKAREAPQARFCWHCRKALHARSDRCPFCGEQQ